MPLGARRGTREGRAAEVAALSSRNDADGLALLSEPPTQLDVLKAMHEALVHALVRRDQEAGTAECIDQRRGRW